ncbi:MAG TPA: FAD-dependent oxidoreductase [Bryobacteraceae bacterium]|jgi:glycine/D-amino acid oxidase-like deaminating enzyme|nr:FAD-dependent oxidoreductase [Bryobacteraceae bacterium]
MQRRTHKQSAVVVGAGAFGGWIALELLRSEFDVTLVDAWGPGNSRASSGGETRIIRATYGPSRIYTQMAFDALGLWQENEQRWQCKLFRQTGAIWMSGSNDSYERSALPILREIGVPFEQLTAAEAAKRWPQIDFSGVPWVIFEPQAGYLLARRACEVVYEAFLAAGGKYRHARVVPGTVSGKEMKGVLGDDSEELRADVYIFACGPWLPKMFPSLSQVMRVTRQEVFFFGPAAGDLQYTDMPVWIDNGPRVFYGIPGNQWRGFKVADDARGPEFDPDLADRRVSSQGLADTRSYLEMRFPGMRGAPLLESRVCQYENSADDHFIVDRHPEADNAWLVGGGSGHGFKHGPALAATVVASVVEKRAPPESFSLKRFLSGTENKKNAPDGGNRRHW